MKRIKLLDCTLRDGGYVNDWKFGHDNLISVFERTVSAGVDIIEIGFLDQRREFDIERSIMPDSSCAERIFGKSDKKQAMVVGMIDFGTCEISHLQPCKESFLDGIRVIFKKHVMHEAIEFCRQVKKLGYKVFTQAVSITSYTDEDLRELIELVNGFQPYAVSIVDTYGLLQKDNLLHYFQMMDQYLSSEIGLGYHSHNNFQLAFSNCIEILRTETEREIIVDGTLYGMGKSAGNAPIELLAMHLNEFYGKNYDMNQLLEAIDGNIMQIYEKKPWGYNLFYYLAASNHCHPSYVQFLMQTHSLSIKSINEILDAIEPERKLMYSQEYIERLYYQYQRTEFDDSEDKQRLKDSIGDREILILGPGSSVLESQETIQEYIRQKNPVVMAINFVSEVYPIDYVFLSNPRRYVRLINALKDGTEKNVKVIATSNVTRVQGSFQYTLNNAALLDKNAIIVDNSFIMLLKVLRELGVKELAFAGLDGYSQTGRNYADSSMEYWFAKRNAEELNRLVKEFLQSIQKSIKYKFITRSYYE